jgi:hypothetical protein
VTLDDYHPDAYTFVDLVIRGEVDYLRRLLAVEVMRYREIGESSLLVRHIEAAHRDLHAIRWNGPLDEHPEYALMAACPHPFADGWGYCCCGMDLSLLEGAE